MFSCLKVRLCALHLWGMLHKLWFLRCCQAVCCVLCRLYWIYLFNDLNNFSVQRCWDVLWISKDLTLQLNIPRGYCGAFCHFFGFYQVAYIVIKRLVSKNNLCHACCRSSLCTDIVKLVFNHWSEAVKRLKEQLVFFRLHLTASHSWGKWIFIHVFLQIV